MPPPIQRQDAPNEGLETPSTQGALEVLRREMDGVTREQRERHFQHLQNYLRNIEATPEERHQAAEGLSQRSVLDIQSSRSRSPESADEVSKAFLELQNRNPERGNIRFQTVFENSLHEATIGLGHILPANVKRVAVTDRNGRVRIGERKVMNRVGYFDEHGYIPVFQGYRVEILETTEENNQSVRDLQSEEREYFRALQELAQQENRATLSAEVESTRRGEPPPPRLSQSPQYRDILQKFAEVQISLPEETLIYAERDLRELPRNTNIVQMLDSATLEIFRIAMFGGRIGNIEIFPPTHEGYDIRFKDIPLFHQFAMRLRDPIFSRTIVSILNREKQERGAPAVTFENLYELIENAYVAQELAIPEQTTTRTAARARPRTEYEIGALLSRTRRGRFLEYVQGTLHMPVSADELFNAKPATRLNFQNWYRNINAPGGEFDYFYSLFQSITKQESGGDYFVLGRPIKSYNGGRALGYCQIMTSDIPKKNNWANWSREIAGRVLIPNPFNQDWVAFVKLVTYYKNFRNQGHSNELSARMTAASWYRGKPKKHNSDERSQAMIRNREPSTRQYCDQVIARMPRMRG